MTTGKVLDATGLDGEGKHLIQAISDKVKRTQLFIIQDLPNELHITRKQFDSMMNVKNSVSYMSSVESPDNLFSSTVKKAYIFYTPHNAMDVIVVDDDKKNLPEAGEMKSNDDK